MIRRLYSNVFVKSTKKAVGNVAKVAFSSKYLLTTNVVISASLSGAADAMVQKACREAGVGKYHTKNSR